MAFPTTIHTEMRRRDRAVDDPVLIKAFLNRARVITLALADDPYPYAVPLSFGFDLTDEGLTFYFHGAAEGRKADLIAKNPRVGFVIAEPAATTLIDDPVCRSGQNYFSVMGVGEMELLDESKREHAMAQIMHHYMGDDGEMSWEFPPEMLKCMGMWALKVKEISAKTRAERF